MHEKADLNSYSQSLKFLSECLHMYHGKKIIILIGEYDVPLESAHLNGYYEEDDGYESIVRYGIAFFGKDCEVRTDGK